MILRTLLSLFLSCSSDDDGDKQPEYNLEKIKRQWVRVGGNNPIYNGMIVNVQNDKGVIVDPGEFPYPEGHVKWKNIVAQDENFSFEDLIDNGIYQPGTIKFGIDDTLRISVQGSMLGSVQKWVR